VQPGPVHDPFAVEQVVVEVAHGIPK
jgi:hypothetical protein